MLIECLILRVREHHEIRVRFTTNGLELKHCLQKKMIAKDEVPKKTVEISKVLNLEYSHITPKSDGQYFIM